MNEYPKQIITELANNMSDIIIKFFNKNKEVSDNLEMELNDLIISVLDEYYEGKMDAESFQKCYIKLTKNRRLKKHRWTTRLLNDVDTLNYEDKNFPFRQYVIQRKVLRDEQWDLIYNGITLEEKIKEEIETVKQWDDDKNTFFVNFPAIESITGKFLWGAIKSDVAFELGNIIKSLYNGALANFFRRFPANLIDRPLFAHKKIKLSLKEISGKLSEEFIYDGENRLRITINGQNDKDATITSLDATDILLLEEFLNHVDEDFYETRAVTVDTVILAKLLNSKPSEKHYEMVQERCLKLALINFTFFDKDNNEGESINFFDRVSVTHDYTGKRVIVAYFGSSLYKTVIEKNIIQVTSRSMESLTLDISKLIYCALQNERIALSSIYFKNGVLPEDAELTKSYSFTFFLRNVRFESPRDTKKNINLVIESLNEFCESNIAIQSFQYDNKRFIITYIPLSQDEFDDLTFRRKNDDNLIA